MREIIDESVTSVNFIYLGINKIVTKPVNSFDYFTVKKVSSSRHRFQLDPNSTKSAHVRP